MGKMKALFYEELEKMQELEERELTEESRRLLRDALVLCGGFSLVVNSLVLFLLGAV